MSPAQSQAQLERSWKGGEAVARKARERAAIVQAHLDQGVKRAAYAAGVSTRTANRYLYRKRMEEADNG